MKLRMIGTACLVAALYGSSSVAPAAAQTSVPDQRLDITAGSCAAAGGSWRDNGDLSSCCLEAACYVCEVDALECQIAPRPGMLYTPRQLVDLVLEAPAMSYPVGRETS